METYKLIIDFKPELPQMIIAKEQDGTKEIKILNVIKGMEAFTLYEQLTGKDKIVFDKKPDIIGGNKDD